jgi:hypothetical protein
LSLLSASVAKADGISQIRIDDGTGGTDVIWVLTDGPDFFTSIVPDSLPGFTGPLFDIFCSGSADCAFRYYAPMFTSGDTQYFTSVQINNEVEVVTTPEPSTGGLLVAGCFLCAFVALLRRMA